MSQQENKTARGRMIHIRLDEQTHRELKLLAVKADTTVQSVVEGLIKHKVATTGQTSKRADRAKGKA